MWEINLISKKKILFSNCKVRFILKVYIKILDKFIYLIALIIITLTKHLLLVTSEHGVIGIYAYMDSFKNIYVP